MNTTPMSAPPDSDSDQELAEARADLKHVLDAITSGTEVDPVVRARVRAAADRNREERFRRYGLVDLAVPLIREARGELPDA